MVHQDNKLWQTLIVRNDHDCTKFGFALTSKIGFDLYSCKHNRWNMGNHHFQQENPCTYPWMCVYIYGTGPAWYYTIQYWIVALIRL